MRARSRFRLRAWKMNANSYASLEAAAIDAAQRNGIALWYVKKDRSNVFVDSNGATTATVGGLIGRVFDTTQSTAYSDNLMPGNGTFDSAAGWTAETGWTISGGIASNNGAGSNRLYPSTNPLLPFRSYRVRFTVSGATTGSVAFYAGVTTVLQSGVNVAANGSYDGIIDAGSSVAFFGFAGLAGFNGSLDNVIVQEVNGSSLRQVTTSKKPTLVSGVAGTDGFGMSFDGTGDYFDARFRDYFSNGSCYVGSSQSPVVGTAPMTLVAMGRAASSPNQYMMLAKRGEATPSRLRTILVNEAGTPIANISTAERPFQDAAPSVVSLVDSGSNFARYANGAETSSGSGGYVRSGIFTFDQLIIGAQIVNGIYSSYFAGTIYCAWIGMGVPNESDRKAIERFAAYLAGVEGYPL